MLFYSCQLWTGLLAWHSSQALSDCLISKMRLCLSVCVVCMHEFVRVYECVCVCMCVCVSACVRVHVCMHVHV